MKTEKNTFSVLFILKRNKEKKNGKAPIHGRITVNGETTQFNTKLEILPDLWGSGVAKGRSAESISINSMMDEIKAGLHKHYHALLRNDGYVTAERLKKAFFGKEEAEKTIIRFFEKHNEQYLSRVKSGMNTWKTYTRYELTKERLIDYMKQYYNASDMPVKEINKEFLDNYYLYIMDNYECGHNYAMKFLQRFRTVLLMAHNNGWIPTDPFSTYRMSWERTERGYLTQEEVDKIYLKTFETKRLQQVRDMFIFSCYTGLSYCDLCECTQENIVRMNDGNLWINLSRQKTNVPTLVRLFNIPMELLNKYAGKQPDGKILPTISNQKTNEYLKEIATLCGINKRLSFHLARHTFATLSLGYGMPIETVSKTLGHTNIRTTQIYAKITDMKLTSDMDILAQRLNNRQIAI